MNFSKELIEKAKLCNTREELLSMAKDNNIVLSIEEADKYFNSLHNEGELTKSELDNVTGGCGEEEEEEEPQQINSSWKPLCGRTNIFSCYYCNNFKKNEGDDGPWPWGICTKKD